jgi:hypothetical protein
MVPPVRLVWSVRCSVGYVSFWKTGGRFLENASHVLQLQTGCTGMIAFIAPTITIEQSIAETHQPTCSPASNLSVCQQRDLYCILAAERNVLFATVLHTELPPALHHHHHRLFIPSLFFFLLGRAPPQSTAPPPCHEQELLPLRNRLGKKHRDKVHLVAVTTIPVVSRHHVVSTAVICLLSSSLNFSVDTTTTTFPARLTLSDRVAPYICLLQIDA